MTMPETEIAGWLERGGPLTGAELVARTGQKALPLWRAWMAHSVPRQEPSTGSVVRGSDLDVIVVAADDMPEQALHELDAAIYRRKRYLLVSPAHREEIDYVIKRELGGPR